MAYKTSIQWTDATVNFWTGCKKVSPGCKYCYMFRDAERVGLKPTELLRATDKAFNKALNWTSHRKIFTCSWSDFFIENINVDSVWRNDAWNIIKKTTWHDWQILTKRPERILESLPSDWGTGYDNVWLGVSIENNNMTSRIDILREIPAKIKFLSIEPIIGAVSLEGKLDGIDWVIIGGESGNEDGKYRYRPAKLDWFADIVKVCKEAGVPVFVKQLGTHLAKELNLVDDTGGDIDEWDTELQVREFPFDYITRHPTK